MSKIMLKWLKLPESSVIEDLDDPVTTALHAQIIKKKVFLKKIYTDFYRQYKDVMRDGVCIELGSGGGFIKEVIPSIKTSDILPLSSVDICFSVEDMPLRDNSINTFFMINMFHHVKEPTRFLNELNRCLRPGGKIIMIEPANTLWGRLIYKNFHHEVFDPSGGWSVEGAGPLSSANGAVPWIIFCRDRKIFEEKFSSLRIRRIKYHTPIRYLISGGFSMRQLLPSFMYNVIKGVEILVSPLNRWIGMFFTIEIQK